MSVIVNLALFPTDKGQSVSPYVARAVRVVEESGLPYCVHSMGTCIEGEWDEVMSLVGRCFKELEKDCDRIYLTLTADCRKGESRRMESKVAAVKGDVAGQVPAGARSGLG